jgi:SsrA-binding protein
MAGQIKDYDPERSRKLLLHKKEIAYLRGKSEQKGLTLIPISVYTKGNKIKLEFALATGKKKYDKRESVKDREQKRDIQQLLRQKMS